MNPIIQKAFDQVKNLFIYLPDKEQFPDKYDNWKSHIKNIENGDIFYGDCDDFCLTCAELLIKRLISPELIRIALCKTETNESHLVCIADGCLLDNRQRNLWAWNEVSYTWISSMKMSEPGVWRKML